MARNAARAVPPRQALFLTGLTLFGLVLFVLVGAVSVALVRLAQGGVSLQTELTPAARALIGRACEYLFFFLLAGSVPFVAATLFQADDLPLLLVSPVSPRAVVAAKLLDSALVNAAQFVVIGLPVLLGMGVAVQLNLLGWLALSLATLLLLALPPCLTALFLLLAARILGLARVKAAVTLVSILLALGVTMLAVVGASRATQTGALDAGKLTAALRGESVASDLSGASLSQANVTDDAPRWLPSAWIEEILTDGAGGKPIGANSASSLLTLILTTAILVAACLQIGPHVLSAETAGAGGTTTGGGTSKKLPGVSLPISGILTKDAKYLARDTILLGQIGTALILFLVPFLLKLAGGAGDSDLYGALMLAMLLLIVYMTTSIVGLTSVGLEGRAGGIMLASPVGRDTFLRGKWLGAFLLCAAIIVPLTLIAWPLFGWTLTVGVSSLAVYIVACFALTGLGVGLAGLFPRFVYENPAHRASVWALVLGFVFASAYLVVSILLAVLAYIVLTQTAAPPAAVLVTAVSAFLLLSLLTGLLPVALASRRLQNYEWEF